MPLDVVNAPEATPPAISDLSASPELTTLDVQNARKETPPFVKNFSAVPMTETAAAGVFLAKVVLGIISGTLVVLFAYLFVMDILTGGDIGVVYSKIINPNKIGSEIYTLSAFDRMITDLTDISSNKSPSLTSAAASNIDNVISIVDRLRSIPPNEKATVKGCLTLPSDDSKISFIKQCIDTLTGIRQAAVDGSSGIADAQIAAEYSSKVIEERAALHSFWIQSAQLILLNLLLPLLTGLFGYIFGTQQTRGQT